MAGYENDDIPMLLDTHAQFLDEHPDSRFQRFVSTTRSASISIPMNSMDSYDSETNLVGYTGPLRSERRTPFTQMSGPLYVGRKPESLFPVNQGVTGHKKVEPVPEKFPSSRGKDQNDWPNDNYAAKNEHLLRSGQLGVCNDPYCTVCPTYDNFRAAQQKNSKASSVFDPKFHNVLYGDAKGWARRTFSFLQQYIPGVMNPHTTVVQRWNKFFVISCLVAVFVDPLFFFLLFVLKDNKCIIINWPMTTTIVVFRSLTDLVYFFHMLLQFRLAYVAPESRVVGAGELVDHPKKIALNYIRGYFFIDLFVVLPLPQIIILVILPKSLGGANYAKNLLRAAVLVQYIPRLYRFLPLLAGQSPSGFVFESAWANFIINLLTFMLSGHVVGSCWYLFGLQRVNECLRVACENSGLASCTSFIDCGVGKNPKHFSNDTNSTWNSWKDNVNASACLTKDGFSYGIYETAVYLTMEPSIITRYIFSLFWGFQTTSSRNGGIPSNGFLNYEMGRGWQSQFKFLCLREMMLSEWTTRTNWRWYRGCHRNQRMLLWKIGFQIFVLSMLLSLLILRHLYWSNHWLSLCLGALWIPQKGQQLWMWRVCWVRTITQNGFRKNSGALMIFLGYPLKVWNCQQPNSCWLLKLSYSRGILKKKLTKL